MKTTIDQAMTKVFQQRDRAIPEPERSLDSSEPQPAQTDQAQTDPLRRRSVDQAELYIDPPQADLRPARPEVLIPPAPSETGDPQQAEETRDRVELSAECGPTESDSYDGMPRWSDPFVYQLSVQAPPSETLPPACAVAPTQIVESEAFDAPVAPDRSHEADSEEPDRTAETTRELSREVSPPTPEKAQKSDLESVPHAASFRPVWEVDCLGLPPICRQVVDAVSADLQRVCQHLSPASGGLRNLVSVDSCTRGEGRTTVALALAHGLAQAGQRILLVDADFGHPSLATQLGLAIRQGWEQSILDGLPIQECCIHSIGDGFTVLPLGRVGLKVHDLRTLQRIQDILGELTQHFDRVLLDNGPGGHTWVALPPDRLLAHVVVRSLRQTSASELQQMLDRIQHPRDVLVNRVDNFATPSDLAMAKSA